MHKYGFVILAAGSSSRLGQPKQLLNFGNKNLLQFSIEQAVRVNKGPVVTVLGSHAEIIRSTIENQSAQIIINHSWEEGMGSSIRCGTAMMLQKYPLTDAIIFMVCDQPYLSTNHLEALMLEAETSQKGIVASTYKDTAGTPVLFHKKYFNELLELKGIEGAKKLISKYSGDVSYILFVSGEVDIDTVADYELFSRKTGDEQSNLQA
jgi:molybdenum cofactor cytidylyltransferase